MHHPLDPPAPFRAVPRLARLIAAGLLDYPECLLALSQAAQLQEGTPSGIRTRLAHALTDAVAGWTIRRARTTRAIRAALTPLLAARAPAAQLRAATHAENRAHGHPLRASEVETLTRAEAASHFPHASLFPRA